MPPRLESGDPGAPRGERFDPAAFRQYPIPLEGQGLLTPKGWFESGMGHHHAPLVQLDRARSYEGREGNLIGSSSLPGSTNQRKGERNGIAPALNPGSSARTWGFESPSFLQSQGLVAQWGCMTLLTSLSKDTCRFDSCLARQSGPRTPRRAPPDCDGSLARFRQQIVILWTQVLRGFKSRPSPHSLTPPG